MVESLLQDRGLQDREPVSDLEARVGEAARLLRALSNDRRLLVLCHLAEAGEASVGRLALVAELSQSALSQHLALMRADGLVATRRQGTTILYRLADPRAAAVVELLRRLYCARQG